MENDPGQVQCRKCRHYMASEVGPCPAFPGGIPEEILTGEFNHKIPFEGDHGIQFELAPHLQPEQGGPDEKV